MNAEERNPSASKTAAEIQSDVELESALRNFRLNIHQWSDQEFARPRTIERSRWEVFQSRFWRAIANPALGGTMAAVLLLSLVGVPAGIQYEHKVTAERQAAMDLQKRQADEVRKAEVAAIASAPDDANFLNDVDSDVSQAAPDAMQPLASLMNESSSAPARR
jgi:hypothetical protein